MTSYIFVHFLPFLYSFKISEKNKKFLKFLILFSICIFAGLRQERGGDWWLYLEAGRLGSAYKSVDDTIISLIYLISYDILDLGIYGVNIISTVIVIFCLNKFLTFIKNFPLGLFVSFQSVIILGAMGYIAQSIAFAFGLLGILSLIEKKFINYLFFLFLSIVSHSSGIFFAIFILSIIKNTKNLKYIIGFLILIVVFYCLINYNEINRLIYFYIGSGNYFSSKGAIPRILISFICAIIYFKYIKNTINNSVEKNIFSIYSIVTFILLPFVFFASTLVDRFNFYIIVLQIYTLCKFLELIKKKYLQKIFYLSIVFIYHSLFLIWMIFGAYSFFWVPYKMFPFQYCDKWFFPQRFCNYFDYRINIDYNFLERDFQKHRFKSEVKRMNKISDDAKKK